MKPKLIDNATYRKALKRWEQLYNKRKRGPLTIGEQREYAQVAAVMEEIESGADMAQAGAVR